MTMEQQLADDTEVLGENPHERYFVHINCPRIEPEPPRWKTGFWPPARPSQLPSTSLKKDAD
jgi:hypothetical protein